MLRVVHLGGRGLGDHAQHGGSHLGRGDKAGGGHVKENLRLGVVLTVHREGAVVAGAGGGADPPGHLPLDHHRDGGKTPRLDKGGDGGGGDVVGQISAGDGGEPGQLF